MNNSFYWRAHAHARKPAGLPCRGGARAELGWAHPIGPGQPPLHDHGCCEESKTSRFSMNLVSSSPFLSSCVERCVGASWGPLSQSEGAVPSLQENLSRTIHCLLRGKRLTYDLCLQLLLRYCCLIYSTHFVKSVYPASQMVSNEYPLILVYVPSHVHVAKGQTCMHYINVCCWPLMCL